MHRTSGFRAKAIGGMRLLGMSSTRPRIGPRLVGLELTHFCALRCSFCESHGQLMPVPIVNRRSYAGGRKSLDLATIERLAKSMAKLHVQWVELSGKGDPIVHPHLIDVVRILKREGLQVSMFTTGSVKKPGIGTALMEAGLDRMNVSLNAVSRDVWTKIAGRDLYDTTFGFLREVIDERNRRSGRERPWVRVSFVVCRDNVDDMDRAVDFVCDLQPDEGSWCVMGELEETKSLLLGRDDVERLRTAVPEWRRKLESRGIAHDLQAFAEDLVLRVKTQDAPGPQENRLQKGLPCYEGWTHAVIGPDGVVAPCCYCEGVQLGNVVDQDFVQIWQGDPYADFRQGSMAMAKTGDPICWECHTTCNKAHENRMQHERRKKFLLTR